jgi:hypothetical protein
MKLKFALIPLVLFAACKEPAKDAAVVEVPVENALNGTWKLVSAIKIVKSDTTATYPVKGQEDEMIKVINSSHFAFFKHDLKKAGSKPVFDSGAGTYTLKGDNYTENLDYCNYREWEGHKFDFKIVLKQDTLIQKGIEKLENLNIDQEIIETYVKVK